MIRVYSQKRSGTHLVMSYIHFNFILNYKKDNKYSARIANTYFSDGEKTTKGRSIVPWGPLFGSHRFYKNQPLEECIYIIRNPYYQLVSLAKFLGKTDSIDGILENNKIEYWKKHVESYTSAGVFCVFYEDLVLNPVLIVDKLQKQFNLDRKTDDIIKINNPVGWNPFQTERIEYKDLKDDIKKRFQDVLGKEYLIYNF